jgi:glycosyltransferase involved in cell wall biosynthesis
MVDDLNLSARVRFVGWVQGAAKYDLLSSARLVVVPSRHETFGLVAVEALASGTPVIAFEIPCLSEVIPAGSGWLVPPFDVEALSSTLIKRYNDQDELLAAGLRGRSFAGRFDWDRLADTQIDRYRDVLEVNDAEPASASSSPKRPVAGKAGAV